MRAPLSLVRSKRPGRPKSPGLLFCTTSGWSERAGSDQNSGKSPK